MDECVNDLPTWRHLCNFGCEHVGFVVNATGHVCTGVWDPEKMIHDVPHTCAFYDPAYVTAMSTTGGHPAAYVDG